MPQPSAAETIAKYTPTPPKQVRDAATNIDAMIIAQRTPPAPPAGQDNQPPAPPPAAPPAGQPAPPAGQPPAPPAGEPPVPAGQDDLEHRYRSLEGRYDNQVRINNELTQRLGDMERMMASMRAGGTVPPPGTPAPPAPAARLVTPEEETEYGVELLDVAGRRAKEVIAPELSAFELRMKALENRVDGVSTVTAATARDKLYSDLVTAVPNWREINFSPEFKDWLQFADGYSGRRRMDLLQDAFAGHETNRVIRFFQGFLEATGTPPSPTAPAPTPGPGQAPPAAPTLEDLAAPGRARSAPQSPVPPEKPTYTSAWYAAFKRDQLMGKWKGREAEAEALERDVFAAQHEGRFIP